MAEPQIKVVKKALDALDFLVESSLSGEGSSLSKIADGVGVQPTTMHNILKTMEQCGYVSRLAGRLYGIGIKCRGVYRTTLFTGSNVKDIEQAISNLAQITGESVVLATILTGGRRVLVRVESGELVRVDSKSAETGAFWSLVTCRVLAAYSSAEETEQIIDLHGMPGNEWDGIDDRTSLIQALDGIQNQGYAEAEPSPHTYAAAVPVVLPTGELVACIGLYMPKFRLVEQKKIELLNTMRQTAADIEELVSLQ